MNKKQQLHVVFKLEVEEHRKAYDILLDQVNKNDFIRKAIINFAQNNQQQEQIDYSGLFVTKLNMIDEALGDFQKRSEEKWSEMSKIFQEKDERIDELEELVKAQDVKLAEIIKLLREQNDKLVSKEKEINFDFKV